MFDLEKNADVAACAGYVVLVPTGMFTPSELVQVAVALVAPFVIVACKEDVDWPSANSILGFGLSTVIVSRSRSMVTV
jgi:hypothetical protein